MMGDPNILTEDEQTAMAMLDATDKEETYYWAEMLDAYRLGKQYGELGWLVTPPKGWIWND